MAYFDKSRFKGKDLDLVMMVKDYLDAYKLEYELNIGRFRRYSEIVINVKETGDYMAALESLIDASRRDRIHSLPFYQHIEQSSLIHRLNQPSSDIPPQKVIAVNRPSPHTKIQIYFGPIQVHYPMLTLKRMSMGIN